jgi:MYCBP-associated protein family
MLFCADTDLCVCRTLLPGEEGTVTFTFTSAEAGMWSDTWHLTSVPPCCKFSITPAATATAASAAAAGVGGDSSATDEYLEIHLRGVAHSEDTQPHRRALLQARIERGIMVNKVSVHRVVYTSIY